MRYNITTVWLTMNIWRSTKHILKKLITKPQSIEQNEFK